MNSEDFEFEVFHISVSISASFKDFDFSAVYECYLDPQIEYEVNRKTELYELKLEAQEL